MKNYARKIIKYSVFIFFSFIFLNVYFSPASVESKEKTMTADVKKCQQDLNIQDGATSCSYDVELMR